MNEIVFAASNGISEIIEPYMIQIITPISSIINIGKEMSFVCFVFIALIDCGRNANVVKDAATKPIIKVLSKSVFYIFFQLYFRFNCNNR